MFSYRDVVHSACSCVTSPSHVRSHMRGHQRRAFRPHSHIWRALATRAFSILSTRPHRFVLVSVFLSIDFTLNCNCLDSNTPVICSEATSDKSLFPPHRGRRTCCGDPELPGLARGSLKGEFDAWFSFDLLAGPSDLRRVVKSEGSYL